MNYEFEYVMSKQMADEYIRSRSGEDLKLRPKDYLMKVVNEDMGIYGTCAKITIE